MVIIIGDDNDETPVCPVLEEIPLDMSSPVGTSVVQLEVIDADIGVNAEIEFMSVLDGGNSESTLFAINPSTGNIRTIA